jgi:hypothetical protein
MIVPSKWFSGSRKAGFDATEALGQCNRQWAFSPRPLREPPLPGARPADTRSGSQHNCLAGLFSDHDRFCRCKRAVISSDAVDML